MGDEIVRKIQVGEKIIEYNLIRKNVKRINMRVKLDGTVWISANDSEPISKIEAFIIKNADEILKFIEDIKNLKELTNEIYILGEKIPVIIKIVEPAKAGMIYTGKEVIIRITNWEEQKMIQKYIKKIIDRLSEDILRKYYDEWFEKCRKIVVEKPFLTIQPLKGAWGKCCRLSNEIELEKLLVMMPKECIEYVVVHEFCHFAAKGHGDKFYATVSKFLPDWQERENLLDEYTDKIYDGLVPYYPERNLMKDINGKFVILPYK